MITRQITSPDGQTILIRVVNSYSETITQDLLEAFRVSVKEILEERKK